MSFKLKFRILFFEEDWIVLVSSEVLVYLYLPSENTYLISHITIVLTQPVTDPLTLREQFHSHHVTCRLFTHTT